MIASALALAVAGCGTTPEQIEAWKGTQKGPDKLREVVQGGSAKPEIRGLAYAALVEVGMVAEAGDDLKSAAACDREAIAHGAVAPLVKLAAPASPDEPKRARINAKDGLFQLRATATSEDRAAIDDALIAWTTADLAHRMSMGAHGTEKILTAIGPRAGARLAEIAGDRGAPDGDRLDAARLLGKIGGREAREQAGGKLIEEAKGQRSLQETTVKELGLIGGDHAVAWLSRLAEDDHQQALQRKRALLALTEGGDPAALPAALRIAADGKAPGDARDAAFGLAEKIGPTAVPGLLKLTDDKQDEVRWQAVEAALKAGGPAAVKPTLEALSTARAYPQDDLRSFVVHDLELLGAAVVPALRDELKSRSWVARIAAVMALQRLGKAEDAAALGALAADATPLRGWPGGATVGSQAKAVAAELGSRR